MTNRTMAAAVAATVALASWLATPSHAAACSCVAPRMQRTVVPADGTGGFPTDGTVRVFLEGGFPEPLRAALASEYRLRDDAGAPVALDSHVVGTRLDLSPRSPLRPGTRYTLERIHAYDASGTLVSDTDRWRRLIRGSGAAGGVRRAWFPVARFRTGAGPAARAAASPRITERSLHFATGGGDCGPGVGVHVAFELPGTAEATDVVELEVRGEGIIDTMPAFRTGTAATRAYAGDMLCNPSPVTLPARRALRVRVVLRGAAGAVVGHTGWEVARARSVPPIDARWRRGRRKPARGPRVQAAVAAWTAPAVVRATPATPPGPRACPHGFEATDRTRVSPARGPWSYGAQSTLVASGDRGWVAIGDPTAITMELHALSADASSRRPAVRASGFPSAAGGGPNGPFVVVHTYPRGTSAPPDTELVALAPDGGTRWRAPLDSNGDGYRVAVGDGRVLVVWSERIQILRHQLAWAVFDARSGRRIDRTVSHHGVSLDGGPAATFVDGRFAVVWSYSRTSRPAPLQLATLSVGGAETDHRRLPVEGYGSLDLATAGTRIALVASRQGRVEWSLLDASGDAVVGPVEVSAGVGTRDNRKPRIAYDGRLFAVGWESWPTHRTHVAAVDAAGRVSPVVGLSGDAPSSTVGVAATGGGLLAAYTVERESAWVAALECRSAAAGRAPERIRVAP